MVVTGALTFDSVERGWRDAATLMRQSSGPLEVDLSGVGHCDSAALALLIDWLRLLRHEGRNMSLTRTPERLLLLAQVSDLEQILPFVTHE